MSASANPGAAYLKALFGLRVHKSATALVQNTSTDLFTVSSGLVAVTMLVGEVTTAVANTASLTAKLTHTPSGGAAGDLCTATVITADAAGTLYSLTTGIAADLLSEQSPAGSEAPGVTFAPALNNPLILPAGTIKVAVSNHDPAPGAVKWTLTYVPIDLGASVAAA